MASTPFQGLLRHSKVLSGLMRSELKQNGFSILDNAFGNDIAFEAKAEIAALQKAQRLHLNVTQHVLRDNSVEVLPKHGIWELSSEALLSDEASNMRWGLSLNCGSIVETPVLDEFASKSSALYSGLSGMEPRQGHESSLFDNLTMSRTTVKVQFNAGEGGCFPLHFDTAPGVDTRFLTAIYYINDSWRPSHGGELQLYPFPFELPPPIEPIADRLVLFSSTNMLHRVLPATTKRYCVTFWMYTDEDATNSRNEMKRKPPMNSPSNFHNIDKAESVALSLLLAPQLRRHFARIALDDEWYSSLKSSHPSTAESAKALSRHRNESKSIEIALRDYLARIGFKGRSQDPLELSKAHLPLNNEAHPDLVTWF